LSLPPRDTAQKPAPLCLASPLGKTAAGEN
jgi:hypothetical protein